MGMPGQYGRSIAFAVSSTCRSTAALTTREPFQGRPWASQSTSSAGGSRGYRLVEGEMLLENDRRDAVVHRGPGGRSRVEAGGVSRSSAERQSTMENLGRRSTRATDGSLRNADRLVDRTSAKLRSAFLFVTPPRATTLMKVARVARTRPHPQMGKYLRSVNPCIPKMTFLGK